MGASPALAGTCGGSTGPTAGASACCWSSSSSRPPSPRWSGRSRLGRRGRGGWRPSGPSRWRRSTRAGPHYGRASTRSPSRGRRARSVSSTCCRVVLTGLVAAGCWLVLVVMRDIAAGDAFRPRNVTRLRVLAVLVAVGVPTVWFVQVPGRPRPAHVGRPR